MILWKKPESNFYSRRTVRELQRPRYASQVLKNRSANRGECSQVCRLPFDVYDEEGKVLGLNEHVLHPQRQQPKVKSSGLNRSRCKKFQN